MLSAIHEHLLIELQWSLNVSPVMIGALVELYIGKIVDRSCLNKGFCR